jgi:hypothetical protein
MGYSIKYLIENSRLPGPRPNLELLYEFITNASQYEIEKCLLVDYKKADSPEEFVLMCGVAAGIYNSAKLYNEVRFNFRSFANHESWRIREGICIGFQKSKELLTGSQMVKELEVMKMGTPLEIRTYIATLSEPCLLLGYINSNELLEDLYQITMTYFNHNLKISDDLKVLKKALGYCWSVALCGRLSDLTLFEKLLEHVECKHIKWIVQENLKKKRLETMDLEWTNRIRSIIS